MSETRFTGFTPEELGDIAEAFDSAAREGAYGNGPLAEELAMEFAIRGLMIPLAYGHGEVDPGDWRKWVAF